VELNAIEREYASTVYNLPAMREWAAAAAAESWEISGEEVGEEVG